MRSHCEKCGKPLERRSRPTQRFDTWSGSPTEYQWDVCPRWRSRMLGAGGHGWRYLGVNRVDGLGPPDPGWHQNPPSPPSGLAEPSQGHQHQTLSDRAIAEQLLEKAAGQLSIEWLEWLAGKLLVVSSKLRKDRMGPGDAHEMRHLLYALQAGDSTECGPIGEGCRIDKAAVESVLGRML